MSTIITRILKRSNGKPILTSLYAKLKTAPGVTIVKSTSAAARKLKDTVTVEGAQSDIFSFTRQTGGWHVIEPAPAGKTKKKKN